MPCDVLVKIMFYLRNWIGERVDEDYFGLSPIFHISTEYLLLKIQMIARLI